jgi:hypothetical protein
LIPIYSRNGFHQRQGRNRESMIYSLIFILQKMGDQVKHTIMPHKEKGEGGHPSEVEKGCFW